MSSRKPLPLFFPRSKAPQRKPPQQKPNQNWHKPAKAASMGGRSSPSALASQRTYRIHNQPPPRLRGCRTKELAASIRVQGVLSQLRVRPITELGFEIVAAARRRRAAQIAEAATVPVRIVNLTDAEALEAQLVENLIRSDVHPTEEANGFPALLALEEPKYSIDHC